MGATQTTIREMTHDDLDAVLPLMDQLGYDVPPEELARRFAAVTGSGDHKLLVAVVNGRIVGFLHVFARSALEKPPEAMVQSMAVDKAIRRGGIGRLLLTHAETWAAEKGFASVSLHSQLKRDDAHAFYQAQGYKRVTTSGLLRKILGD